MCSFKVRSLFGLMLSALLCEQVLLMGQPSLRTAKGARWGRHPPALQPFAPGNTANL